MKKWRGEKMRGRIHSLESMGLMDGPGIRFVVFMQGCKLRCAYCHNPDTWDLQGGSEMEPQELMDRISRYIPYFKASGGGVTFSGGEPLLQPEFLLEMLKLCRNAGIHTALDTAGVGSGCYKEILEVTDLVILDLKHSSAQGYKELTGLDIGVIDPFVQALSDSSADVWIRHVVVPGITDSQEHIIRMKSLIRRIPNVKKVELIPYHSLGENKYAELGYNYRLAGVEPLSSEQLKSLEAVLKEDSVGE
jgi:pyruvate formate lyase activating enzyme